MGAEPPWWDGEAGELTSSSRGIQPTPQAGPPHTDLAGRALLLEGETEGLGTDCRSRPRLPKGLVAELASSPSLLIPSPGFSKLDPPPPYRAP